MFALIKSSTGIVCNVSSEKFEVHPDFEWVEIQEDDTVKTGYIYQDGNFVRQFELQTADQKMAILREKRDSLLVATDHWALTDREMTAEQVAYRQSLRDITKTATSLEDVVWPELPES